MRKKKKEVFLFAVLAVASLMLIGLDKLDKLNWFKRPVEKLANPLLKKVYRLKTGVYYSGLADLDPLDLENNVGFFEREKAGCQVRLEQLEKENQAMKKLLGAPLPPDWQFIPAQVLGVNQGVMIIDQGSDLGVKNSQVVVFEEALIGKVVKVNPKLSRVQLPLFKDSDIKVKILGTNGQGLVRPGTEGSLILDQVLQEVGLQEGQTVVTSGGQEEYPPNLLVGKIKSIEKQETAVFQQAVLEPLVDYYSLEEVFVVKDYLL